MKKLVIFDLDGTLVDSLEDLGAAVNYALALRGLPQHTDDEYRRMVGHGVRNLVRQALERSLAAPEAGAVPELGAASEVGAVSMAAIGAGDAAGSPAETGTVSDELISECLADFKGYYSSHIDVHTRPYPGIPELLGELHRRGVLLAVATNKFQSGAEHIVHEFFPDIPFVAILGNRDGYPLKPSPEIVEEVLQRCTDREAPLRNAPSKLSREEAVLVGDSPTDMRTAHNGGIDSIAVSWGYRTREDLLGVLDSSATAAPSDNDRLSFPIVDSVSELGARL